jgi:hypothetical protein
MDPLRPVRGRACGSIPLNRLSRHQILKRLLLHAHLHDSRAARPSGASLGLVSAIRQRVESETTFPYRLALALTAQQFPRGEIQERIDAPPSFTLQSRKRPVDLEYCVADVLSKIATPSAFSDGPNRRIVIESITGAKSSLLSSLMDHLPARRSLAISTVELG